MAEVLELVARVWREGQLERLRLEQRQLAGTALADLSRFLTSRLYNLTPLLLLLLSSMKTSWTGGQGKVRLTSAVTGSTTPRWIINNEGVRTERLKMSSPYFITIVITTKTLYQWKWNQFILFPVRSRDSSFQFKTSQKYFCLDRSYVRSNHFPLRGKMR